LYDWSNRQLKGTYSNRDDRHTHPHHTLQVLTPGTRGPTMRWTGRLADKEIHLVSPANNKIIITPQHFDHSESLSH